MCVKGNAPNLGHGRQMGPHYFSSPPLGRNASAHAQMPMREPFLLTVSRQRQVLGLTA